MNSRRWISGITFVLGLLLAIAPWVFGYANVGAAVANEVIVGLAVAVLSLLHMARPNQDWAAYVTIVLGVWTFFASLILGYSLAYWPPIVEQSLGALIGFTSLMAALFMGRRREPRYVEFASAELSEHEQELERKRHERLYGKDQDTP